MSIRAIFRRLGTSGATKAYVLLAGAVASLAVVTLLAVKANSLSSLERDCWRHLVREPQMAEANGLSIEKHFDFWNHGASGGGAFAPWSVAPHIQPKVIMILDFNRGDKRQHLSWIECLYDKQPNSGDPPQLTFHSVRFSWENVLEGNRWLPWHPNRASGP